MKLKQLLLSFLALLTSISSSAYEFETTGNGWAWTCEVLSESEKTVSIIDMPWQHITNGTIVKTPQTVTDSSTGITYSVVSLGKDSNSIYYTVFDGYDSEDGAFYGLESYTIIISEGVTSIHQRTFWALEGNGKIYLPYSLTYISSGAFWCDNLTIYAPLTFNLRVSDCTVKTFIPFKDKTVRTLCVAKWDKNGDGVVNETEAAAVTDLGEVFKGNTTITSFDELQYFTGLTSLQDNAFKGCTNLTSFIIPRNVTSIGGDTFRDCKNLISISVADGNTIYDSRENCNAIINTATNTLVAGCKNTTIPNGVTSIGFMAFFGHPLTSIIIPESLTSIDRDAFYSTSLTSIVIPDNVQSIGYDAFGYCCDLTSITIGRGLTSIDYPFRCCTSLTSVNVDEDNPVFDSRENCNAIIETATNTLVAGCMNTFIPNGVTSIGDEAFWAIYGLTSITIPYSVTNIGNRAFSACNLTDVYCEAEQIPNTGSDVFSDEIMPSATLHVPAVSLEAYKTTAPWSGFGRILPIIIDNTPNIIFADANVKAICVANWDTNGDGELSEAEAAAVTDLGTVFKNNTTITSFNELQYFTGLTEINDYAFRNTIALTSVIIPENVTRIGKGSFGQLVDIGASNLVSVQLPDGLTEIDEDAFWECNKLKNINFPTSLRNIGECAFHNTAIESLILPEGFLSLGYSACNFCSFLKSIYIPSTVTSIGEDAFSSCNALHSIVVSEDNTVYDSRENCNALIKTETNKLIRGSNQTIIPLGICSIGDYAFERLSNLYYVTIPKTVTSIGDGAFMSCGGLTDVWCYAEAIPSTGNDLFYSTNIASATLHVPAASMEAYSNTAPWSGFGTIVPIEIEEKNYLTMADTEGIVGGTIMVPVCLENEDEITAFQLEIDTPDGVSVSSCTLTGRKVDHTTPVPAQLSNGNYQIVTISGTSSPFSGNEGVLLNIVLTLSSEVAVGDYPIIIKNIELTTPTEIRLTPSNVTATLTVKLPGSGDVNGDGKVTITDAVGIVNYILERPSANFRSEVADLNGDGRITITDAVAVVNRILIQGSSSNAKAMAPIELQEIIPE